MRTDHVDIYQVDWLDPWTPFEETMEALLELKEQGTSKFIGLSNFDDQQPERCVKVGAMHVIQPPYNLFERSIESGLLPYC